MREAASDVCSIAHERAATKQTARQTAAHAGCDDMAPSAVLLALRICESYSTRLAPCIRGHLVRNAAHEGFCISLLGSLRLHVAHGRHEPRLRDELAADARPGRELEHAAHDIELYRLEDQLVAGKHRPLEASIVDAGEEEQ